MFSEKLMLIVVSGDKVEPIEALLQGQKSDLFSSYRKTLEHFLCVHNFLFCASQMRTLKKLLNVFSITFSNDSPVVGLRCELTSFVFIELKKGKQ